MASWDTTKSHKIEDSFRPTLVNRAKKRHGIQVGQGKWIVDGNPKLGDQYDQYFVTLPEGERKYRCSCQGHQGGEYRKICSHIVYITLARRGKVDIDVDIQDESPQTTGVLDGTSPSRITYPLCEMAPYVEGSGASIEEAREALNSEFNSDREYRSLPAWIKYLRQGQVDALEQVLELYEEGKKVVFLDAPTGAGKTLIGEMVRRKVSPGRTIYTCSTLTLQDQFLEDFDYADVIKGRANYPTMNQPNRFPTINASQCTRTGGNKSACELCDEIGLCPYESAKATALKSKLAVANIAYLLTMANYQNKFTDQPLIIIDEADVLEQQLLGFITVSISKRNMVRYGIKPPEKKTVMSSWVEWIRNEAHPKLVARIEEIKDTPGYSRDKKLEDERGKLQQLVSRLKTLGGWDYDLRTWLDEEHGLEGWVYMDYEKGDATFKPITVADYAQDILWRHAKKWLLMSATIISAQQMAEDLGLEDHEWGVVTMGSDFPIESRPIYVQPIANMTWKEKDVAWPAMAEAVGKVVKYHQGERVLVHTVSYALARYLKDNMVGSERHRVHTYTNSREREPALRRWLDRSTDGVMLAPSFDRGVDLKGDLCRVVVVTKVPYPNLKDKQVNGRLYSKGGQGWYSMLTIRSVVQMTGRAMRSSDDSCETYVLDRQFVKNIMNKNRKMIPKWWSEALVKSGAPKDRKLR